jgi:hypothetical protein
MRPIHSYTAASSCSKGAEPGANEWIVRAVLNSIGYGSA